MDSESLVSPRSLMIGITASGSTPLISGQLAFFSERGWDCVLVVPVDQNVREFCASENADWLDVKMEREIAPMKDILSLSALIWALLRRRPDVVNFGTPKMGLLGMLASFLARVPARFYTCRGFRYEHEKGLKRLILMWTERVSGFCAHRIICISPSVRERGIKDGVFNPEKTVVIGPGSSNGVDIERFDRARVDDAKVGNLRKELELEGRLVLGFVGRLVDRKGILELYSAYRLLKEEGRAVSLVLLGSLFESQFAHRWLLDEFQSDPHVHWVGFQNEVPEYMALFNVFVMPAWWEGFGNVLVQAAGMGIPVISTRVTGCRDAVNDGVNGVLVEKGDIDGLAAAIRRYLDDDDLRRRHGEAGVAWAHRFRSEIIWNGLEEIYLSQLGVTAKR